MAKGELDFKKIRRPALDQGWRTKPVKAGENFLSPDGKSTVNWHNTPSDVRAVRNFLGALRRAGLKYPPPREARG